MRLSSWTGPLAWSAASTFMDRTATLDADHVTRVGEELLQAESNPTTSQ